MAFCPICKNEYRAGVSFCPDCNCELVDRLANEETPILYIRSEHIMNRFVEYLSYSGIQTTVEHEPENDRYAMYCSPSDNDRVKRAFSVFVAVETGNAMASRSNKSLEEETQISENDEIPEDWEESLDSEADESIREFLEEDAVAELTTPAFLHSMKESTEYVSAVDKQRENKESGMILIILGIVLLAGIYGLRAASYLSPFSLVALSVIATLMFFYGIYSFLKSKKYSELAVAEERTIKEIREFLEGNLTRADLETLTSDSEFEGPELDLQRQQVLIDRLKEAFPDCEEPLLLHLSDEWYSEQFGEE